ncbi:sugar nucleotide-binding protein [Corynebacterium bovis]|uniref:SDR family oxidoreductase n=1 Tax=Corynebacterium bovis TaxID=36808 RepID=UPI002551BAF5|nr:sugar nucleotide-binding protein [Corynebacterium bovis]MDK8511175.1 sugar nucleotide-binding protein [Corynebacterium bovis]
MHEGVEGFDAATAAGGARRGARDAQVGRGVRGGAPTVLVTGATGQVGRELTARARGAVPVTRAECDLREVARTGDAAWLVRRLREADGGAGRAVVNLAAWTDVDGAEDPAHAAEVEAVNAVAPGILAAACADAGVPFVHVSTDYVFGGGTDPGTGTGTAAAAHPDPADPVAHADPVAPADPADPADPATTPRRPWRVDDPPAPLNVYGATKRRGEEAVFAHGGTVVRTSWVWSGPHAPGRDFVATMASLAGRGVDPRVVDDQWGRPTFAADLAAGLERLVVHLLVGGGVPGGILHHTNSGEPVTWYDLAREVFRRTGHDPRRVTPCPTSGYPTVAPRPAWSVLDLGPWTDLLGEPPAWQDGLERGLR